MTAQSASPSAAELVGIVIPVYNRENLITRCLDSVWSQTYRPLEVVVVDNASTDGTADRVTEWIAAHQSPDFRITLLAEPRQGAAVARNTGLRAITAPWMLFFDSDDEMHPDLVSEAVRCRDTAEGEIDVVNWKVRFLPPGGKPFFRPFHKTRLVERQFYNAILATQCYMVRTDFIRSVGGWDESTRVWDDWELGLRILFRKPGVAWSDTCLATIHPQDESLTGTGFAEKAGTWEAVLDLVESRLNDDGYWPGASPREREKALDRVNYRRAILAAHYMREGHPELAQPLLNHALSSYRGWQKQLLKALYQYTRHGGRGAYYLWEMTI